MPTVNSKTYIDLVNVTKTYPSKDGERIGVSNMNMTIQKDELVAVVGHSGCGKTTLLNLVSGIVSPTSGAVKIDEVEINEPQSNCGFVFQEFSLFPWRTVIENVEFGSEIRGINKVQRQKTAKEYLKLVGLLNVSNSYPDVLSGGMKQRVAIARALAYNPTILLMDEPFGSLDSQTREEMQEELLKIWNDTHKTIIFVTHDIREAVFLAKRVFLMKFPQNTIHRIYDVPLAYPRDLKTQISKEMNELVFEIAMELKSSN